MNQHVPRSAGFEVQSQLFPKTVLISYNFTDHKLFDYYVIMRNTLKKGAKLQ